VNRFITPAPCDEPGAGVMNHDHPDDSTFRSDPGNNQASHRNQQLRPANAVIDPALRMLEERDRKLAWLHAELAVGEEQEKRGDTVPYTPDFMERLMWEADDRSQQGMPVSDAVQP
jgi:hypothetical protein